MAALCLAIGGIIVGVPAWLVKNPPALFLALGEYLDVGGLTDGEREGIVTEKLMAVDTVHEVRRHRA